MDTRNRKVFESGGDEPRYEPESEPRYEPEYEPSQFHSERIRELCEYSR